MLIDLRAVWDRKQQYSVEFGSCLMNNENFIEERNRNDRKMILALNMLDLLHM